MVNDYERPDTDPRLETRGEVRGVETGPEEVEIYDRPATRTTADGGTGMGLWVGLLVLIVVAVLVVMLLLFLF